MSRHALQQHLPRRAPRTAVLALLIVLAITPCSVTAAEEVPDPPEGESAITVLSIIRYNRNICDSIAGRVLERWQRLGDTPEAEQAIRDYLVDDELSELTSARTADDIVRSFSSVLRSENRSRVVSSLDRMRELTQELCDTVAWPSAPRQSFADEVARILDLIEGEQEELGGQLVVSQDELRIALDPYLAPIQIAGIEAHDEYLDYLESLKPKPRGPTLQELLAAWYDRYTAAVNPTKQALAKYLQQREANQTRELAATCREILAAVIPLLRDDEVFEIPTPQLPASKGFKNELLPPLQGAYREIRELAVDCTAGRQREVLEHFGEMQKNLQEAAVHLQRYSIAP